MISVSLGLITLGLSWERLREHTSFPFIHWSLGVHADSDGLSFASNRTLFNSAYATLAKEDAPGILASAIEAVLGAIGSASNDVATYPNPFYKYGSETNNPVSDNSSLSSRGCTAKLALTPRFLRCLFSDDQHGQHRPRRRRRDQPEHVSPLLPSLPFHSRLVLTNADCLSLFSDPSPFEPLLIPARGVDAILAFDNSADTTYSWPNGSALWTTYQRFDVRFSLPHTPSSLDRSRTRRR